MYTSKTDLARRALWHLSEKRITDITAKDDTNSILANDVWNEARDSFLIKAGWLFAKKHETLSTAPNDRPSLWGYKHNFPGDYMKLLALTNDDTNAMFWSAVDYNDPRRPLINIPHEILGKFVYSNVEVIGMDYVHRMTDVIQDWPSYAQWAFTFWLASLLVAPASRKPEMIRAIKREAMFELRAGSVEDFDQQGVSLPEMGAHQSARHFDQ